MIHSVLDMPDLKILWDVQVKMLGIQQEKLVWLSWSIWETSSCWLLGLDVTVQGEFGTWETNRSKDKQPPPKEPQLFKMQKEPKIALGDQEGLVRERGV